VSNVIRLRPDIGIALTNATLPMHAGRLTVPNYDRSALTPAVVHIGVGGSHRAHQQSYFDDLARQRIASEWGVIGVGLHHRQMGEALAAQNCLYTVVERGPGVERARVVGTLCRYLYAPEEPAHVRAALADERTRVVSLTLAEDPYYLDPGTEDADGSLVRTDLRQKREVETAWAYLAEALDYRRRNGIPPFTVLSCDDMPDNGKVAHHALVSFAQVRYPKLAQWIDEHVAFPSSTVDRITPQTSPLDRDVIEQSFGVADRWPVICEPFSQWVVEDDFSNGRPPLDRVGVQFVSDIAPYQLIKSRLVNGSLCAIAYLGILAGYRTTAELMADRLFRRYVEQMMQDEILPLLPSAPGWDPAQYCATMLSRLSNPQINEPLSELAARGSMQLSTYLLPSVMQARTEHRPHHLLTLAVAAWMRYVRGYDLQGRPVTIDDPRAQQLTMVAKLGQSNPRLLLELRDIFGTLSDDTEFATYVGDALRDIDECGVIEALHQRLNVQIATASTN
jgi:mannitol 2-dehydrogenase